ncbi:hypothetical protein F4V43_01210 [Paenibacillus spiritus]|uniref:Uncharacterized protein n=1 Tax=Paenibacillus spiritus TaxID=2496557 RepID=A0A5J5GJG7_9BACL|nr:hypothetical protein [Paenibacillus spiritus]KAA9008399.1 hypothetical protein F4V43_01210 [Paenibacillus spiritus]
MNDFTNGELIATGVFALLLIGLALVVVRSMARMGEGIIPLRRRTLVWFQISLVLTVVQLNFKKDGDWRFSVILGLIVLFTGAVWLFARSYERKYTAAHPEAARDTASESPDENRPQGSGPAD